MLGVIGFIDCISDIAAMLKLFLGDVFVIGVFRFGVAAALVATVDLLTAEDGISICTDSLTPDIFFLFALKQVSHLARGELCGGLAQYIGGSA